MKKSLKLMAIIAAVAASTTMLASCGGNGGGSGSAPTLKWLQIGGQPNDLKTVTEELNKYSAEKIGVKCEYTYLDWGVWGDRIKAILNSGEPFDIMFNNSDVYASGVGLGRFAELDGMLDKVPALKDSIPEGVWSGTKVGGKIYAVPTYKDSSQTQYWVWDKAVTEKYNVDYKNIHTVKELDPVLYTLQDAIKKGEITQSQYAFYNTKNGINGMFMNYDAGVAQLGVKYDDPTATVIRVLEQPDMMEVFTYMHKWYKDGIINPDAPTVTESAKWNVVASAQGFPGADVGWGVSAGGDVVIEPWGGPLYSTGTIMGSVNSISSSSKYKEESLKYLELVNTDPVMRNMLAHGIEGTHFSKNDDGTINELMPKSDDYRPATYSQATFFTLWPVAPAPADQWTQVKDWNGKAKNSVLLGFAFDRVPVETEIASCAAIGQNFDAELYTGASDPAVKVPEYYKALEGAGLQKIQDELQKQINEFLKK